MSENEVAAMSWCVYMLLASDNSLYTGITNNPAKRFRDHLQGNGAKYFRGRKPVRLLYAEAGHDRASASRREIEIKKLKRSGKLRLIEENVLDNAFRELNRSCFGL
ncbi:GIY-YIG nuclease family protein [Hahella sp. KA22]|uniref:GIY-YIG nuclease family protein n=1 Tax=Hahella sp. KA22 TaxID=1628392 RepID=UPI000FDEB87E|nr:GIY-YIG nuclease family protein [Hahella sp. KA22]AZZ89951.1 GIY-YIG nuclease family protein [Hahella sp. KA22]QAY53320.1 GIY-YIG nuclease family protein [Hahella sp. KA22]